MILPVKITQSSVALKVPVTAELLEGALAVNVVDGALYTMRHDNSIIRIEGDTGNGAIASGASVALGAVMAGAVDVTGTTTITAIVLREGQTRTVRFTGALTLTNSATLVLPGGASVVTVAGDYATFRGYASGITRCMNYTFSPANVVTLAGVQTLTNKTLTSPVINAINGTPIGGTTRAAGAFTTLSATGAISSAIASNYGVNLSGSSTGFRGVLVGNTGAATVLGVEGNVGSSLIIGSPAYSTVLTTFDTNPVLIGVNNTEKLRVSSTGLAVMGALSSTGTIAGTGGFGCNGSSPQTPFSLGAAATDLPTAIALANKLRTMAINNGMGF